MDMVTALVTYLEAQSLACGQRIYPSTSQGREFPFIVYQRITLAVDMAHDGPSGLEDERIQLDCWGDYDQVSDLALELEVALSGYKGLMGTVNIGSVFVVSKKDGYDEDTEKDVVHLDVRLRRQ